MLPGKFRPARRLSIRPWTRPSHGAWNGGSPAPSDTTGPKPCMPPRSWGPPTRRSRSGSGEDLRLAAARTERGVQPEVRVVLHDLPAGNRHLVDLVGAVGDAQRAHV